MTEICSRCQTPQPLTHIVGYLLDTDSPLWGEVCAQCAAVAAQYGLEIVPIPNAGRKILRLITKSPDDKKDA